MELIFFNGDKAPALKSFWGYFHGASIFTTLRTQKNEPMFWDWHWHRLFQHAQHFDYRLPDEKKIRDLIQQAQNEQPGDLKIRVILSANDYLITCEPMMRLEKKCYQEGVRVHLTSQIIHPQLGRFKTGNSLPYQLAQKEALSKQAFEGLLCDGEGHIVDGSRTSPMLYDGKCLLGLKGGLQGIMREIVFQRAKDLGLDAKMEWRKKETLKGQLLIANCLLGLLPVYEPKDDFIIQLVDHFQP